MAQKVLGDVLKKGEEIFQNVSGKLLEKPAVAKAFEAALAGKSKVDEGVAVALKRMNVQTRSEFRGLKNRVESLEGQLRDLQAAVESLQAATAPPAKARRATPRGSAPRKPRAKKA